LVAGLRRANPTSSSIANPQLHDDAGAIIAFADEAFGLSISVIDIYHHHFIYVVNNFNAA
jgi:hypothetical protein